LDWLIGREHDAPQPDSNPRTNAAHRFERFKRLHVAMTRPRHLLCLALNAAHINDEQRTTLQTIGWQITDLRQQQ